MSKSDFAKTVISQLKASIGTDGSAFTEGSASAAMSAVAAAITNYLVANTTVTVTYQGVIPGAPPVNDPVTVDSFSIIGTCAPTGPSDSFDSWIRQIEANIISGFQLAPMGNAGVSFPTLPFANPGILTSQTMLKAAHDIEDKDPQQKVWEIVCGGIMDWIGTTAANLVPGAAARTSAPSTGVAVITGITIN